MSQDSQNYAITPLPQDHILSKIGEDLTVKAHTGSLPKTFGREKELDQMIKILGRRAKSNPLILGEAGVGKTSLGYALAERIVSDHVPPWLRGRKLIRTGFFEIWGALARTGSDGDFAEYARVLKQVLKECRENPVILFMDEFHTLVHYPISSNVIKPALADGSLRIIGATTLREFRLYLEKDEALTRRFIPITLEEPSPEQTRRILGALKDQYEKQYGVTLPDPVLNEIVDLSEVYLPSRNQPDKSIDLLELSCIEAVCGPKKGASPVNVTESIVKKVTASVTGIPEDILNGDTDRFNGLVQIMASRFVGQEEALQKIAHRLAITKSRANLEAHRPDGVFLVAGPQGSGKTELARSLAGFLSDFPADFIPLDMGIYGERHALSVLLGGAGGQGPDHLPLLTYHIKNRPSAILLLEDVDSAHADVLRVFQQIFAAGRVLDYYGTELIFDHVTIFMTTRVGFENRKTIGLRSDKAKSDWENRRESVLKAIEKIFPKEFLQYVDEIVVLKPMDAEMFSSLIRLKMDQWSLQLGKRLELSKNLNQEIIKKFVGDDNPANALSRFLDQQLGKQIQKVRRGKGWDSFSRFVFDLDPSGGYTAAGVA